MAARSGKVAKIAITAVTPTSSTDNSATLSTDGVTLSADPTGVWWQRHWDRSRSTGLRVFDGTTEIGSTDYEPNFVQGKVVFNSARSTSNTYTIDVDWLTASYVAQGRNWQATVDTNLLDATAFSTTTGTVQWRTVTPGLSGAEVTIDRLWANTTGPAFFDRLAANQDVIVELWGDTTSRAKLEGYAYVSEDGFDVPIDAMEAEAVSLTIDGPLYYSTE